MGAGEFLLEAGYDRLRDKQSDVAAHAGNLPHQSGRDRADHRGCRQKHRLYVRRQRAIHARHRHFVVEIRVVAQPADQKCGADTMRRRHHEIIECDALEFAAGFAQHLARGLFQHGEPLFRGEQWCLAGMHADGAHQLLGQPGRLTHHVEVAVGDGIERAGIKSGASHGVGSNPRRLWPQGAVGRGR